MAIRQSLVYAEMLLIYSNLFNKHGNYSGQKEGKSFADQGQIFTVFGSTSKCESIF